MNQEYFVKQRHSQQKETGLAVLILLVLIGFVLIVFNPTSLGLTIGGIFIGFGIICFFLEKRTEKFGLYLTEDEIYYQKLRKKPINISKIAGIKITRAMPELEKSSSPGASLAAFPMLDSDGHYLYSMIFVSEVEESMKSYYYGDLAFLTCFRETILFSTVYDENLLHFLKWKNPDIIIMDGRDYEESQKSVKKEMVLKTREIFNWIKGKGKNK